VDFACFTLNLFVVGAVFFATEGTESTEVKAQRKDFKRGRKRRVKNG
jgi:hypothetical protein